MATATVPTGPQRVMDKDSLGLPEEIQTILRAPLPPDAIKQHPTKKYLSTIKPAFVIERMNEAFGIGGYTETYREISVNTISKKWGEDGEGEKRDVLVTVAAVHGTLTIPRFPHIHLEQYGGSENPDAGDALKGAATDAFTKICSHLGVGLDVYKGLHDGAGDDAPNCPNCQKKLRRSKDGNGWYCWTKKGGCGANLSDDEVKPAAKPAMNGAAPSPAKKGPAAVQTPPANNAAKITISNQIAEITVDKGRLWVKVGDRRCTSMQEDIRNRFVGKKGQYAELLVSEIKTPTNGTVWQIHKVISIRSEREEAGHAGF